MTFALGVVVGAFLSGLVRGVATSRRRAHEERQHVRGGRF